MVTIAGGYGHHTGGKKEIMEFDGENWNEVGQLNMERTHHAMTTVRLDKNIMDWISCN